MQSVDLLTWFILMQDALRETEDHDLGPAISHFFNCLFGSCQAVSTKGAAGSPHSRTPRKACF